LAWPVRCVHIGKEQQQRQESDTDEGKQSLSLTAGMIAIVPTNTWASVRERRGYFDDSDPAAN
jgi:hypothetical protein